MTQIYALIGSPGAKAQPSFIVTRHAKAKRRRGPAGEHVMPACFPWSPLGSGNGRSGWERLAGEGRGLWQVKCLPGTPPMDTRMPLEDQLFSITDDAPRPPERSPSL